MILEAFPEVHKVKCLNHTSYKKDKENGERVLNEMTPGHVTVVTIADREHHSLPDHLRPNVSLGLQEKIKNFLTARLSNFVTLWVVNPTFEEVQVNFNVKFHPGFDETYYKKHVEDISCPIFVPLGLSRRRQPFIRRENL